MLINLPDYDAVRAAIDLSLTASELPDAVIALPIYAGIADAAVKQRDPSWSSRTEAETLQLTSAAVLWTASLVAPAIPALRSESHIEGYSYSREVNYVARAAELRQQAEGIIQGVVTPTDPSANRPTFFTLGRGRRGR